MGLGAKLSLRDALARYGRTEADPTDKDDRPLERPEGATRPLGRAEPCTAMVERANAPAYNEAPQPIAPEVPLNEAPTASLRSLAKALQRDLSPAAEAVQALLQDPTPEAARTLIARLPELLPQDPEMTAILEEELAEAFCDTLAETVKEEVGEAASPPLGTPPRAEAALETAKLGVTKSYVSRVLHGERQSKRVEAAARKMGWQPLTSKEAIS